MTAPIEPAPNAVTAFIELVRGDVDWQKRLGLWEDPEIVARLGRRQRRTVAYVVPLAAAMTAEVLTHQCFAGTPYWYSIAIQAGIGPGVTVLRLPLQPSGLADQRLRAALVAEYGADSVRNLMDAVTPADATPAEA